MRLFPPCLLLLALCVPVRAEPPPVRLAIMGLAHDHARIILGALRRQSDVQLVGIVEPDPGLVGVYERGFSLPPGLFAPTLAALLARTHVDAVAAFTSTRDHLRVVEECAAHGIPVMMEKPMAVSLAEARAIAAAAERGRIPLIINYETTWYPSVQAAYARVHAAPGLGQLRKLVALDGNPGPKGIHVSPAFLGWLTDAAQNGGGASMDFGCYGADLMTYIMDGRRPDSVTAVFSTAQPQLYRVEDEATIILTYPGAQGVIQASWNWPFGRKELEIYGQKGALLARDADTLTAVGPDGKSEAVPLPSPAPDESGFLPYLAAVVRGTIRPSGPSGVEANLVVCEILDAARQSARTGRRVDLPPSAPR